MQFDVACYFPDNVLAKAARGTKFVSLEARGPLLDQNVVDSSCPLPPASKGRPPGSKLIRRQILAQHVPASLFVRSMLGSAVPIGRWLGSERRNWVEELLAPAALSVCR